MRNLGLSEDLEKSNPFSGPRSFAALRMTVGEEGRDRVPDVAAPHPERMKTATFAR